MTPKVVSFTGVKGSGKDHHARLLAKKGYTQVDFKDELIAMCSDLVGYDVKKDYDWFKDHLLGMTKQGNPLMHSYALKDEIKLTQQFTMLMNGRKLLQRLGTDVMRKRDKDYWARAWYNRAKKIIDEGGRVVVADCRFINEVIAIKTLDPKASFIFCNYKSHRYDHQDNHESELMAQRLLHCGLQDGEEITERHFAEVSL